MANWIFQGNPGRYDVLGDIEAGRSIESWSITRHLDDVALGDRAALWIAGRSRPGIYALGHVTGEPFEGYASDAGWLRPEDQGARMWFCPVSFDILLTNDPIPRELLKAEPAWASARIITQPQAGNPFLVSADEWRCIEQAAADRGSATYRSVDNVWLEIQAKARLWKAAGTPVFTLQKNIRNVIVGVTKGRIERRSDQSARGEQSPIRERAVANLWEALCRDGDTLRHEGDPLYFTYALLQRAIAGIGFEPDPFRLVFTDRVEANRAFSPDEAAAPGLVKVEEPRRGGRGSGGEGPVHAALKERVKSDPIGAVGERLTYLTEDLTESLGAEVSFVTGDRVDLLMKDEQGNYVVIEVEPQIGPTDHVGFHQAAKYWVLLAVARDIDLDRVRRMVVATSIDAGLRNHYMRRYGIESFEVEV